MQTEELLENEAVKPTIEMPEKKKNIKPVFIGFIAGMAFSGIIAICVISILLKNVDFKTLSTINKCEAFINELSIYDLDRQVAQDNIIKGYLAGVNDIYTEYYTPQEAYEEFEHNAGENFCGIGVLFDSTPDDNGFFQITSILDGGAKDVGIKPKSLIKKINSKSVSGLTAEEVASLVRGEEGTSLVLTVEEDGQDKEYTIIRRKIVSSGVSSEILDNNIGYIAVTEFLGPTDEDFIKTLQDMSSKGVNKLIIDLRSNGGGDVETCSNMIDAFIDEKPIFSYETKNNKYNETINAKDGIDFKGDVIVLMDENTASASEIFTGVLSEYGIVKTVGTKTFGKGIVQELCDMSKSLDIYTDPNIDEDALDYDTSEGVLKITVAKWCLPSGKNIHGEGLEPDYEVEFDYETYMETGMDNQLEKAIELLQD